MRSIASIVLLSLILVAANAATYLGLSWVGMGGHWIAPLGACVTVLIISWWPA